MHKARSALVEKQNLLHAADEAELAAGVTAIQELDGDELVRVEGSSDEYPIPIYDEQGRLEGFINRGGWICTTGLPRDVDGVPVYF